MENKELSAADVINFINNCTKKETSEEDAIKFINKVTKNTPDIENVIDFIDHCTEDEFKKIKSSRRIYKYVDNIRTRLEDDIENLKDEISDLENLSYDDIISYISNADDREIKKIAGELKEWIDYPYVQANNLYDEDKVKILLTAFDKYNLDQLMEKLEITWNDVI